MRTVLFLKITKMLCRILFVGFLKWVTNTSFHSNTRVGKWGGSDDDPVAEFRHDLSEIESSDVVVALLEERVSAGVQIELGYAFAKGKSVYLFQIGKPAWSNTQFASISGDGLKVVEDEKQFVEAAIKLINSH
jgi:hypothetical protein